MAKAQHPQAFALHDPRRALGRLVIAVVPGIATALAIPVRFGPALRAVAAWDVAAVVMGSLAWLLILRADAEETRRRAAADDPGRHVVSGLVILASCISLLATSVVLRQARTWLPEVRDLFMILCALAVVSAWLLTHTAYTLRYAHLYYREDEDAGEGGLVFPGKGRPAYLEFAYFAFTIGMCFQVSDVAVSSRQIRRSVLGQSLLSFLYNTAILATAVNLAVGVFN
jgi:uncharacterized membrane protein